MASSTRQGGIQQLLAAEQEAQRIVNNARNAKMARLKQAKEEAEKEIAEFRAHMEAEFQKKLAASSGDSGANVKRLELETKEKIRNLEGQASSISYDVCQMLLRQTPLQVIHVIGNFMRIWPVYILCITISSFPARISGSSFPVRLVGTGFHHLPDVTWNWRPMANSQVVGLVAMISSFYFSSRGWATRTNSPLYFRNSRNGSANISWNLISLRRVIGVSLKNRLKRRLHAITVASETCFLFPLVMWNTILLPSWAYLSTFLFGVVFIFFYVDNLAEERLLNFPLAVD